MATIEAPSWTEEIHALGGEVIPTPSAIFIKGLTRKNARRVAEVHFREISQTTRRWQAQYAEIEFPGGEPIVIPEDLPEIIDSGGEAARLLYTASMEVDPVLLKIMNDLMARPRQAAVVSLPKEQQIILSDANRTFIPDVEKATQYSRPDYWNLSDLEEMRRESRQNNSFEFTYRAQSAPNSGEWRKMTTRYRLFQDDRGRYYHESLVLSFEPIEIPV